MPLSHKFKHGYCPFKQLLVVIVLGMLGGDVFQQRCEMRLLEWITGSHVDVVNLLGYRVDDALQQSLVAHHHRRFSAVVDAVALLEPLSHISCLHVFGRCRCVCYFFRFSEVAVYIGIAGVEFVGEVG